MSETATLTFLLAEEKAYWFKNSSVLGLLPDGGLIREWRNIPKAHRDACIAALKARRKETDPKVEGIAHPGLFRIVSVDDVLTDSGFTLRETLALGMATTIDTALNVSRIGEDNANPGAATTQAASTAHPAGTSAIQQPTRAVTLKWVNIDPNALEAIRTLRTDVTAATLTVNSETLTGTWYKTKITTSQDQDGSGIYSEVWALGETAFESVSATGKRALSANRVIINVPKDRVKTVLDAEITALGATYAVAGYTYTQRVNWSGDTAEITTEASKNIAMSDTNTSATSKASTTSRTVSKDAATIPDATAAAQGITYKVIGDINATGDFDYISETDTAVKQEIAEYTAEISAAKTVTEVVGKNLYDTDIDDVNVYEPITIEAGHIKRLEKRVNPDGTFNDVVRDEASTSQTASTDGTHSDRHYDDDAKTIDAVVATAASAPAADVAFTTQGTVTNVKNAPNEDGTLRTEVETTVAKTQEIGVHNAKVSAAETVTEKSGKQLHDADLYDASVAATQGHVVTLEKRENNDGTFDEVLRDALAIDQTASTDGTHSDQHLDTLELTEDTVRHTAATAALTDVAYSTPGTLVETESIPNENGTFKTSAKTTVSKEVTLLADVVVEDKFRQVQADIGKNIFAATVTSTFPIAKTTGEVQTRTLAKNPNGTYQVERKRDIAVQNVTNAETTDERKAFEASTRSVERNSDAATIPSAQSAGTIVSVNNKVNDYNLTDITIDTRTAVSAANGVAFETETEVANDSVKVSTEVKNATSEPDLTNVTPAAGVITVKRKSKNDFALWDYESSTDTASYQYDSGTYVTRDGTVSWSWGINATSIEYSAALAAISLTNGTDNTLHKTTNKYGLIDYFITKNPYNGGVFTWGESTQIGKTRKSREYAKIFSPAYGRERRWYRDVTYTFSVGIKHSYVDALTYIDGGEDGSSVESHGNGRYAGYRVTSISNGNWLLDETGVT